MPPRLKPKYTPSKPKQRPVVKGKSSPLDERLAIRAAVVRDRKAKVAERRRLEDEHKAHDTLRNKVVGRPQARVEREEPRADDPELNKIVDKGSDKACLKLYVPAGIGDFSWIYSKLCHLRKPLDVTFAAGGPPRTGPFTEILPWVQRSSYGGIDWRTLKRRAVPSTIKIKEIEKYYSGSILNIEANMHLEAGRRIESWVPELPVNHHYDIDISYARLREATDLLPSRDYVAIFTSGVRQVKSWKSWTEFDWINFMEQFRRRIADMPFIIVGAKWDLDMAYRIVKMARARNMRVTSLVNKLHISSSLAVLKLSKYFVGFPSGLTILADVLYVPTTMFYSKSIINMPGTFADPERIASGDFNELLFCPPRQLVDWLSDVYKLKDKL